MCLVSVMQHLSHVDKAANLSTATYTVYMWHVHTTSCDMLLYKRRVERRVTVDVSQHSIPPHETHHNLHHLYSVLSHLTDELEYVDLLLCLSHVQHGVEGDERTRPTDSGADQKEEEGGKKGCKHWAFLQFWLHMCTSSRSEGKPTDSCIYKHTLVPTTTTKQVSLFSNVCKSSSF